MLLSQKIKKIIRINWQSVLKHISRRSSKKIGTLCTGYPQGGTCLEYSLAAYKFALYLASSYKCSTIERLVGQLDIWLHPAPSPVWHCSSQSRMRGNFHSNTILVNLLSHLHTHEIYEWPGFTMTKIFVCSANTWDFFLGPSPTMKKIFFFYQTNTYFIEWVWLPT